MSKINVRSFSNENEDGAPDLVGISTFSATSYFVPTRGTTEERPSGHVEVGSLRYNYDTKTLEFYRGDTAGWASFELIDPELGGGTESNAGLGGRALFTGTSSPGSNADINQITISTLGNSTDFGGDLVAGRIWGGGTGNRTRAITINGYNQDNTIQFGIFASGSDFTDFGDSTQGRHQGCSINNQIRAMFLGGGTSSRTNIMDYITMSQTGNAVDFGDLTSVAMFASG